MNRDARGSVMNDEAVVREMNRITTDMYQKMSSWSAGERSLCLEQLFSPKRVEQKKDENKIKEKEPAVKRKRVRKVEKPPPVPTQATCSIPEALHRADAIQAKLEEFQIQFREFVHRSEDVPTRPRLPIPKIPNFEAVSHTHSHVEADPFDPHEKPKSTKRKPSLRDIAKYIVKQETKWRRKLDTLQETEFQVLIQAINDQHRRDRAYLEGVQVIETGEHGTRAAVEKDQQTRVTNIVQNMSGYRKLAACEYDCRVAVMKEEADGMSCLLLLAARASRHDHHALFLLQDEELLTRIDFISKECSDYKHFQRQEITSNMSVQQRTLEHENKRLTIDLDDARGRHSRHEEAVADLDTREHDLLEKEERCKAEMERMTATIETKEKEVADKSDRVEALREELAQAADAQKSQMELEQKQLDTAKQELQEDRRRVEHLAEQHHEEKKRLEDDIRRREEDISKREKGLGEKLALFHADLVLKEENEKKQDEALKAFENREKTWSKEKERIQQTHTVSQAALEAEKTAFEAQQREETEGLAVEREALGQMRATLEESRSAFQAEKEELETQRELASKCNEALIEDRLALDREREAVEAQGEALGRDRQAFVEDIEAAKRLGEESQNLALQCEREAVEAEKEALQREREAVEAEKEALQREKEEFDARKKEEVHKRGTEEEALRQMRETLETSRTVLEQEREAFETQRAAEEEQKTTMAAERESEEHLLQELRENVKRERAALQEAEIAKRALAEEQEGQSEALSKLRAEQKELEDAVVAAREAAASQAEARRRKEASEIEADRQRERDRQAAEQREREAAEQQKRELAEREESEREAKATREREAAERREKDLAEQRERELAEREESEREAKAAREREAVERREKDLAEQKERELAEQRKQDLEEQRELLKDTQQRERNVVQEQETSTRADIASEENANLAAAESLFAEATHLNQEATSQTEALFTTLLDDVVEEVVALVTKTEAVTRVPSPVQAGEIDEEKETELEAQRLREEELLDAEKERWAAEQAVRDREAQDNRLAAEAEERRQITTAEDASWEEAMQESHRAAAVVRDVMGFQTDEATAREALAQEEAAQGNNIEIQQKADLCAASLMTSLADDMVGEVLAEVSMRQSLHGEAEREQELAEKLEETRNADLQVAVGQCCAEEDCERVEVKDAETEEWGAVVEASDSATRMICTVMALITNEMEARGALIKQSMVEVAQTYEMYAGELMELRTIDHCTDILIEDMMDEVVGHVIGNNDTSTVKAASQTTPVSRARGRGGKKAQRGQEITQAALKSVCKVLAGNPGMKEQELDEKMDKMLNTAHSNKGQRTYHTLLVNVAKEGRDCYVSKFGKPVRAADRASFQRFIDKWCTEWHRVTHASAPDLPFLEHGLWEPAWETNPYEAELVTEIIDDLAEELLGNTAEWLGSLDF